MTVELAKCPPRIPEELDFNTGAVRNQIEITMMDSAIVVAYNLFLEEWQLDAADNRCEFLGNSDDD